MLTLSKAGRYEISGEIGRGAMGVVYRANDPVIGRTVAVKTLQLSEEGTGLSRTELLARFQTEARAAGLLTHPNIVVVYDAGEEEGLFFITMELVEGKSLQHLLDSGQMFPLPRVLRIMEQTCSALQFAHDRNIVHRDIKPANLMLTPDDIVKITDFGTAKILQFGTVQQTAHVMGTPSYMSPEQVKGKVVDGRSDIFSLGVMLYEMVTGEKPFPGQNITTVIYKIVNEEPVPPKDIDPSIHPGLSTVIMRALAKDPAQRYQSCRDFLEELKNYRTVAAGGANPNATLAMPANSAAEAPHLRETQLAATSRSLNARAAGPAQTPVVRRTGAIPPAAPAEPVQEKKRGVVGTILGAILLLGVIVFGAQKIRPVFEAARQQNRAAQASVENPTSPATTDTVQPAAVPAAAASSATDNPESSASNAPSATPETLEHVKPAPPAPAANSLTAVAADYRTRIAKEAAQQGFANRLSVLGSGTTLTLHGKLRPAEHSELLHFLRGAPSGVLVVDDIQYDDGPVDREDNASHPAVQPGRAGIHIITNVIGATASLGTAAAPSAHQCETPCSIAGLPPGNYSLQVVKSGFQPMRTMLQLDAGRSVDQKVTLEPLAQGLFVDSNPAGADVFINGSKQGGQTPVTLPLAPGKYNLVVRMAGHDAFSQTVAVGEEGQTKVEAELKPKAGHVAWAQVDSTPPGADILVDGIPTGKRTPDRVEISPGIHHILLKLDGYRIARNAVQASEGGTVTTSAELVKK